MLQFFLLSNTEGWYKHTVNVFYVSLCQTHQWNKLKTKITVWILKLAMFPVSYPTELSLRCKIMQDKSCQTFQFIFGGSRWVLLVIQMLVAS